MAVVAAVSKAGDKSDIVACSLAHEIGAIEVSMRFDKPKDEKGY